ncbi:MAG TPA: hypothetical protein VF183_07370 [Acidimicrobiales bacterium]
MTEREFLEKYSEGWRWEEIRTRTRMIGNPRRAGSEEEVTTLTVRWRYGGVWALAEIVPKRSSRPDRPHYGAWIRVAADVPRNWPVRKDQRGRARYESPWVPFGAGPIHSLVPDPQARYQIPRVTWSANAHSSFFTIPDDSYLLQTAVNQTIDRVAAELAAEEDACDVR